MIHPSKAIESNRIIRRWCVQIDTISNHNHFIFLFVCLFSMPILPVETKIQSTIPHSSLRDFIAV